MAAGATYEPIATQTLISNTGTVTFSSIPATYTDLVVVLSNAGATSAAQPAFRFNGDTAANYSVTNLSGDGSSAISFRASGATYIQFGYNDYLSAANNYTGIFNVMNYANANTFKTSITRGSNASVGVGANVGLWRSTAAITSIAISPLFGAINFLSGSTFTIYGIAAA
jgi:hypothetical protein